MATTILCESFRKMCKDFQNYTLAYKYGLY